ncbi:hypothetical protein KCU83_g8033, partial [Aureobasidium melanogenum]
LQPLDVSLFRPLASYYSQTLHEFTRLSQGLASLTKRDFFKNFYGALDESFTEANISPGWRKTGIEPFEPEQVLKVYEKEEGQGSEDPEGDHGSRSHTDSCLDSPSAVRTIRRIVNEEVAYRDAQSRRTIARLGASCINFAARATLAEARNRDYEKALNNEKKKRKRGRPLMDRLRAQEGSGALFFSPSKIQKARELQDAKEAAKEQEALDRAQRALDRAGQKAQKTIEAQQKREDREARAAARKTDIALRNAQQEKEKEAKKAQRNLKQSLEPRIRDFQSSQRLRRR